MQHPDPELAGVRAEVSAALDWAPAERPAPRPPPGPLGAGRRTDGQLLYAVGDVHGCYRLLLAMFACLAHDAAGLAQGRVPTLILCGDYVDRGPQSAQVLEALAAAGRHRGWRIVPLKGNHEAALLRFLDDPSTGPDWMHFGG